MNNSIITELLKVKEIKINFNQQDTEIFIPKKSGIKLNVDKAYILMLSDTMLHPENNSTLVSNWNCGSIPTERYYKAEVNKVVNDMIKITGIGYDYDNHVDRNSTWVGWVPLSEMEIMEEI